MPSAQQQVIMGQMHRGHMPPLNAAKQAAAAATQTIAASQNAATSNKNTAAHQQLVQSCKLPPSTRSFQEAQSELNQTAADLNQSAGDVVHASRGSSTQLADASGKFSEDFDEFLDAGIEMAGHTQRKDEQIQVIGNLKNISMASSKLLLAAKSLSVDPGAANAKNLLAAAARAVTESINQLITLATQQAPGQKECDNALRELEAVKGMLANPNEPVSNLSYFHCIESVMENSKVLGESMAGISQNCKTGDVPAFGGCVGLASKALCGLTEAAGQASYLVGVSDPNSQAGHQGLVDAIQFARANQAIQMACQNLVDPDSSPSQVLSSATIVAKHTSALCNACRLASSKTANPTAKRHFVQSAKEVANSTANLVKTIKALDGDFSQENRNTCLVATAPLIEAVENLTAFASNPEFASSPAQISNEGSAAQEPILQSARSMLDSSTHLLKTARSLVINPKDPPTWSVLAGHSRTVSDSIKGLITAIRDKAPGQRECDYSIDNINRCIRNIEQASLAAVSQNLASRDDISLEALQEQLTSTVQEIGYLINPISTAARGEAAQLGHKVTQLAGYFEPLIRASVGVASKLQDHQQQMTFLDQTKTLAESALQMIYAAKEGGGNPKASHTHDAIAEASQLMREAVDDIMVTLNEAASEGGMVGAMVDSIAEAMGRLDEGTSPEPEGSFVDYQTTMVKYSKAIAVTAQEMMTKSVTCPEELGGLASRVTTDYSQLALQGRLAAHTAEPQEIGFQIKADVQELGHGCIFLVQKAGALQITPSDSYTKRELIECARTVTEKVSMVLSALQAGNKGTQACITAASAVSGIIAELDTTIMFASAGTLNAENDESFADHRCTHSNSHTTPNRSTDDSISIALHTALSHLDKRNTYVRMLFIDYSSAFNTIVPTKLITKLRTLGLNTSLCNWILDFLTMTLRGESSCTPCSPKTAKHDSNTIITFADNTTVVGLITDKMRQHIWRSLETWQCDVRTTTSQCDNVNKTKELTVDYRKRRAEQARINIDGAVVERVESLIFLGVQTTNKLSWSKHTKTVLKRARQSLSPSGH
uniref:I/LWEQ domain-containing protein n=1 Tax=Oncorhynchus tshawytscha TaxID=74940 RepID=A0A8C8FPS1_ONCTS